MPSAALTEFVAKRKPAWDHLAAIVARAGSDRNGVRRLSREDLKALGSLYRRAANDLAYVRLRGGDPRLVDYLNDLVFRAHGLVYSERTPRSHNVLRFLLVEFPRLLRRRKRYIYAATLVFWFGFLVGAAMTTVNPDLIGVFLPSRADDVDFYKNLPTTISDEFKPTFAATLMANNIGVAFRAFAVGVLAGFPTLILLFANGLPIGSLAVQQHNAGYDVILWSFLLPHGVPELTAIFIAGGAGMLIGHALIAPGELPRKEALVVAGKDAIKLLLGTVVLFVIAGFIESFISPTDLPAPFKFAFAALMAVGLAAYFRASPEEAEETEADGDEEFEEYGSDNPPDAKPAPAA
jgi:Uncharacterized membrane protein